MRILGITIPDNKRLEIGLTEVYGIGRAAAHDILDKTKIDYGKKGKDATTQEEAAIRKVVEDQYKTEGDLKREVAANVKRLKDIDSYRGSRHTRGLPSRGQRTRTNNRTLRGNKRQTMGTGRRKLDKT